MPRLAPLALLLLSACGQDGNHPAPGPVTQDEARAIVEAEEMLEERRLSLEQLRNVPALDRAPAQDKDGRGAQEDAGS
ncbi:MAG: hypothetical protein FJX31_01220 [Alphaproteobacteria bacterium]|nr:hypothetical protein [Alphaproteobacteria bacterium]